MKKQTRAFLSLLTCLAVMMSVFSVVPISATELVDSASPITMLGNFENGINNFPVIDSIYSGTHHYSLDSTMTEEALNGDASLKVIVPEGNARTEVVFAESKLNNGAPTYKYNVSNSNDGGIFFRMKINNDSSTKTHQFAVLLSQSGVAECTFLGYGAILYDLEGNEIKTTSASLRVDIPANFDGFVYLPFASARSKHVCKAGSYDNYIDNPDCMVKLNQNYKISFMFGNFSGDDKTWEKAEIILDDICVIGSENGAAWDAMRALGYEDILNIAQPDKYTFPVDHENLWQPIQSFQEIKLNATATDYTYSIDARLTDDADKVLLGNISTKITTKTVNNGVAEGVIESFRTNTITFEGIEALSTEKIKAAASDDYAYLKMRIKVPTNASNSTYNIWPVIKQQNNCYLFGYYGVAYNADGTKNSSVIFKNNQAVQLPSGFDGYLYMPVYRLRDTDWNLGNRATTAYTTDKYVDPVLDSNFDFFIHFTQNGYNLDNAEIIIDDIDFVYGAINNGQLPFTFDEMVYTSPVSEGYKSGWKTLKNITRTTGKDALNGNASLMVDIQDVYNIKDDGTYEYYSFNTLSFNNVNGITSDDVSGVMLRMKLLNDTSTGTGSNAHGFYLTLEKSGYASTCIGGKSIKLFDTNGKPVPSTQYVADAKAIYIPSGFDGYIFFPLSSRTHRNDSDKSKSLVDITIPFKMQLWFVTPKNWSGVDAIIDDISYYSVADSSVGLTETDAINAIKSHGYEVQWAEQPAAYDLSFDFEDYMYPFTTMNSIYGQLNGDNTYPNILSETKFVTGEEALSGNTSLKFSVIRSETCDAEGRKFVRAETAWANFNGIESLDKNSIANNAENYAYLTMKIKVPTGASDSGYQFNVYAKQTGVSKNTRLRPSYGYTTDGEYVEFTVKDGVTTLPAGFEGTIYMPLKKSTSEYVLATGVRAMYGNSYTKEDGSVLYGNDYMVDFSKQFSLRIYLPDSDWANTEFYIDDIQLKQFERADFDNSGSVDATDVVAISQYIIGANTTTNEAYDLNSDGYINVIDVVRIKRIIAGLV